MAKQRYIKDSMRSDNWFSDLDPIEKCLWMHLLTNEKVSICGIYEMPIKRIAVETGLDKEMIPKLLIRFEKDGKCYYRNGRVIITNFFKNLGVGSEKDNLRKGVQREIETTPQSILNLLQEEAIIREKLIDTYKGLQGAYKELGILYLTLLNLTKEEGEEKISEEEKNFFSKIEGVLKLYQTEGYEKNTLENEARICYEHYKGQRANKIPSTQYSNRVKNSIKFGNINKAKKKMEYATLDSDQ